MDEPEIVVPKNKTNGIIIFDPTCPLKIDTETQGEKRIEHPNLKQP